MRVAAFLGVLALVCPEPALARERAPIAAFRRANPCPSTGKTTGKCPGWVVDHKYPLCANGADAPENLQWEPIEHSYTKDRLEREVCALRKKLAAPPKAQP